MKLINTHNMRAKSGMTLLELTVVILVLLSLVSILFIGARAWKRGSDRAVNILNIRNVQQAMRAYANVHAIEYASYLADTEIVGPGKYLNSVSPPNSDIVYSYLNVVPAIGMLYLTRVYAGTTYVDYDPDYSTYAEW
jgi:prepilin-type N-terminal cleavage/methylation domain-containing protein